MTFELTNLNTYLCIFFNLVLIIYGSTQSQDSFFSSLDALEFKLVRIMKLLKVVLKILNSMKLPCRISHSIQVMSLVLLNVPPDLQRHLKLNPIVGLWRGCGL
jgi:hypothetical protein